MAYTTTNLIGGPIERLRTLLAASSTFQTLVGAEDAAAAKAHIYAPGLTGSEQLAALTGVDFTAAEPADPSDGDTYRSTTAGTSSVTAQTVAAGTAYEYVDAESRWQERSPIQLARPFAVISGHLTLTGRRRGTGPVCPAGELAIFLEADVPAARAGETNAKLASADEWFCDLVGSITNDILAATPAAGQLDVRGFELPVPIERSDYGSPEGDYYRAYVHILWGAGP